MNVATRAPLSGWGLGWVDERFASGQWVFEAATGQMTPADSAAVALIDVVTANLQYVKTVTTGGG